ncbi:DUF6555 family protein [Pseudomonas sp. Pseusp122]|uniref:DUF6555 family protein n=1 Tax=unclassified Pseudomonas TaxID=196821 RepID=UPI0039A5BB7D
MPQETHYRIDYLLNGAYKTFYIRAAKMTNAEAWHWAAVDAGLAQIPKYRNHRVQKISKPTAEQLGVTNVEWSKA